MLGARLPGGFSRLLTVLLTATVLYLRRFRPIWGAYSKRAAGSYTLLAFQFQILLVSDIATHPLPLIHTQEDDHLAG